MNLTFVRIFRASFFLLIFNLLALQTKASEPVRPGVRVTTGVVETKGWENGLIKRNPSLSHWHWNPIYSYKQSVIGGSKGLNRKLPAPNYPSAHRESSHYVKPVHVPFSPEAMTTVERRGNVSGSINNANVSGNLHNEAVSGSVKLGTAKLQSKSQQAAQYNNGYTERQSFDSQTLRSISAVHGNLKEERVQALRAQPKGLPRSKK